MEDWVGGEKREKGEKMMEMRESGERCIFALC